MDTGKIKALATGARIQLMDGVRASLERVLAPDSPESINERNRVNDLRNEAKDKEALVERVAYTWFNRLCALRLMDSRGYTPVPVVTPRSGETMPAILADARRGIFCADFPLKPADKQRVATLVSDGTDSVNPLGEAYVILLLSACDYYAKPIPALFGSDPRSTNAMRLLAPTSLLAENSILQRIVEGMDDENCKDVEVMGWLYQFYIAERKDEVFAGYRRGKKASREDIKPATQLFTPNWIVRYLVENSLGRLWMLNFPESDLAQRMEYYIAPEQSEGDYLRIDGPEDITFLDPAMGSSHILVYAFDLLYDMYIEEGYRAIEIPSLILRKNLTGFEIDDRAFEIAAFALTMKARERDVEYFDHVVEPDLTVFHSIELDGNELQDAGLIVGHTNMLEALAHLDEVGSLYNPDPSDAILLEQAAINLAEQNGLFARHALGGIQEAAEAVRQLTRTFTAVAANPPYMGSGNMNPWLAAWTKGNYKDEKNDLCTCFLKRMMSFVSHSGFAGIITSDSWIFVISYKNLRECVLNKVDIQSMIQLKDTAYHADTFGANAAFCWQNITPHSGSIGDYYLLSTLDHKDEELRHAIVDSSCDWHYRRIPSSFGKVPGAPFGYWISDNEAAAWDNRCVDSYAVAKCGMGTSNNEQFVRLWQEVAYRSIGFGCSSIEETEARQERWYPYNKAGDARKWYGNLSFVVNFYNNGEDIRYATRNATGGRIVGSEYYFKPQISWGDICTSGVTFRRYDAGFIFDATANTVFPSVGSAQVFLGYFNSELVARWRKVLNPTKHFKCGDLLRLPFVPIESEQIETIVDECVELCKKDWDSFEGSWDYARHPLLCGHGLVRDAADTIEKQWRDRFNQLRSNEEQLNRLYAKHYGLEDEIPVTVQDEKVSVHQFVPEREIKSLISYAIGCMFGRYSLDQDGLILADQGSTLKEYFSRITNSTFMPDRDGILPITEEEWFEDDIVTEFWRWLKAAFGEEHFDENISYIEEVLGCKLREYFIKGKRSAFYDDHCKTYSVTGSGKRPIYWMFSSPNSSFNCLVYMHRYDDRTVSKILTDYVRELRRKLEAQARGLEVSDVARDRTRAAKYHDMIDELNDWERDVLYPMAQRHITIDLDDGVRHNYKLFPGALRKVTGLS